MDIICNLRPFKNHEIMKWRILTIVLFFTPAFLIAQPTVIRAWLAHEGSVIVTQPVVDNIGPGAAGANVEWDFSGVTPDTISITFRFVPADTTEYYDMYPEANLCLYQDEFKIYNYLFIDESTLEEHGIALSAQQLVYSDPKTLINFPFTYESSLSDDYESARVLAGFTYYTSGSVEIEGDAYGTLHLPGETFPDVLRVKTVDMEKDSADLGSGYIEVYLREHETYTWYSINHPGPLATHSTQTDTQIGILVTPDTLIADTMHFVPVTSFHYDPTAVYSGTHTFESAAFDLEITPNPFHESLTLSFNAENPQDFGFELRSLSGEIVFSRTFAATTGRNQVQMTPAALPAGTYVAILRGKTLATTRKIVRWE